MESWVLYLSLLFISAVLANNPTVRITSTDPPSDSISGVIIQSRGKDIQLTCVVEDKPHGATVQWTMNKVSGNRTTNLISTATNSIDAFRYAIDRPSATSWRLRIQNAQEDDEGLYTCKVEVISHNNVADTRLVRVVEYPQIKDLDTSTDMTKKTGESARLECFATGKPQPVVKWTRMAGELLPTGGSVKQGNVLFIKAVQSNDAGYYICTAGNYAGADKRRILLTVKFKPEVTTAEPTVRQKVGYVKQLVCNIKCYPLPRLISWKREGRTVIENERVQLRNIIGAYNRITSIIDIRGVKEEDYGRYECSASNDQGKGRTFVELDSSTTATPDRSNRIVNGGVTVLMNILFTAGMVVFTCLLQHHRSLH